MVSDATKESSTSKASVTLASLNIPFLPSIGAGVITATSNTTCRVHGTVFGSSVLGQVVVNGKTYNLAAGVNTKIPLGLATITLNEQISPATA